MLHKMFNKRAQKEKILVVDDEPAMIMIISKYLEHKDYAVITAENGEEALQKAIDEKPDLVLLDARMPVMDGWETLKRVRKNPHLKDIPVVMVTACAQRQAIAAAIAWDVDDYVTKPFDPVELVEKVNKALKSKYKRKIACDKS